MTWDVRSGWWNGVRIDAALLRLYFEVAEASMQVIQILQDPLS
jgi:hypothetical protein